MFADSYRYKEWILCMLHEGQSDQNLKTEKKKEIREQQCIVSLRYSQHQRMVGDGSDILRLSPTTSAKAALPRVGHRGIHPNGF